MEGGLLPLLLCLPLLAASALSDLRDLKIPNSHVLAMLSLAAVVLWFLPPGEIGSRLIAALVTFGIGFGLFSLRLVGGGDVKMLPVLMLLVPSQQIAGFLQMLSAALLTGSLAKMALQNTALAQGSGLRGLRSAGRLPMAVCFLGAVLGLLGWHAVRG